MTLPDESRFVAFASTFYLDSGYLGPMFENGDTLYVVVSLIAPHTFTALPIKDPNLNLPICDYS